MEIQSELKGIAVVFRNMEQMNKAKSESRIAGLDLDWGWSRGFDNGAQVAYKNAAEMVESLLKRYKENHPEERCIDCGNRNRSCRCGD